MNEFFKQKSKWGSNLRLASHFDPNIFLLINEPVNFVHDIRNHLVMREIISMIEKVLKQGQKGGKS